MQNGISISAIKFDNEPFTRSLTATIMSKVGTSFLPATGSGIVLWDFPTNTTYATTTAGVTYTSLATGSVSAIGTLIFYFSADTYNYLTETYTLNTLDINAYFLSGSPLSTVQTTAFALSYDTFPNIDLTAYLNYEFSNSDNYSYFYRLTSTAPYLANLSLSSTTFNLASSLSGIGFNAWYTVNNQPTQYTTLSTFSFNRSISGSLSSVKVVLSAFNATGSLSSWYTPHTLTRTKAVKFVPYFLTTDWIGWPGLYFSNAYTQVTLTSSSETSAISASPGMEFYGEGHTETIYLSSLTLTGPLTPRYTWRINNSTTQYLVTANSAVGRRSSVLIGSTLGEDSKLPVSLHVTDTNFLTTDPFFYYDDTTGLPTPYPYYISTTDINGNELTTNTKFHKSIYVKPYDASQYIFKPGINSVIYLPVNGSPINYTASLQVALSAGISSTDPCYNKYGIAWRWSTFEGCSALSSTNFPSTWASTQCLVSAGETGPLSSVSAAPGAFPKKWGNETLDLSAGAYNTNPIFCTGGTTLWTLSSVDWGSYTQDVDSDTSTDTSTFNYSLRLSGYGINAETASYYNDTQISLNVQKDITCQINQSPYDWQAKTTTIDETYNILSVPPPRIKLYTANRYVLTGTEVKFENLITNTNLLCSLTIDFGDGLSAVTFDNTAINQNFYRTYNTTGQKTVRVTGTVVYDTTPITLDLTNIIEVVSNYDEVVPENYRSTQTPVALPYPSKIQIAANDWAIADVFNSCVEKFYKNLEYLETRGSVYNGTYSDYFGWLGPLPLVVEGVSACPQYTWEDVNCNINPDIAVTWYDAATGVDYTGNFSIPCGTWLEQTCGTQKVSPTCFGLYNVNWQWKARKAGNTETPITWKQTKCSTGVYPKRWYFEPSQTASIVVCDEGVWNINLPNLNQFYDPIGNCKVQNSCRYKGVVSKNNILYLAQTSQVKVLSSDYTATFYTFQNLFDGVTSFSNIKNVCLDSEGKIIVLDADLTQVAVYTLEGTTWELFVSWGGVGTVNSRSRFYTPNDIHVDQFDNIWVTDTGNSSIKAFSNSGTWLRTVQPALVDNATPLSVCVDSQNNLHVLTTKQIEVYTDTGTYLFSYDYSPYVTGDAVRINTSYNREIIYLCTDTQVVKFFRNGIFNGYIIQSKDCVNNITSIYQDEFRNLLITTNDKVLKYSDLMTLIPLKGTLPDYYWKLEDLYIHPEEYVQNWVYNKALQRLWDNIEIFRSTILYTSETCKQYQAPAYSKDQIKIGQNEIVTSTVVNRCLGYLWENFKTLIDPFDPSCTQ